MVYYNRHSFFRFKELGAALGYPECCIKEFISDQFAGILPGMTLRGDYGQNTGFIPCLYHCMMIEVGLINLHSLIQPTRIFSTAFPSCSHEEFYEFIKPLNL
ncbi:hypothetical protein C1N53_12555 [Pontibacter sp. SGAir0037]|nr:hypothetical protein C1N53_12555 [Pontibacter sp. SGAir0037]